MCVRYITQNREVSCRDLKPKEGGRYLLVHSFSELLQSYADRRLVYLSHKILKYNMDWGKKII